MRLRYGTGIAALIGTMPLMIAACSNGPQTSVQVDTPVASRPPIAQTAPASPASAPRSVASTPAAPSEAKLGLPIYPGAKPYVDMGGLNTSGSDNSMVLLQTEDSLQTVIDYYKQHLTTVGPDGQPHAPQEQTSTQDGQPVVSFSQIEGGNGMKVVEIRQGDNGSLIELMHIPSTKTFEEITSKNRD